MRILHYFLGFPPYRSGGLTKYSFDLMKAQATRGDEVLALWPGTMRVVSKKIEIRQKKRVEGIENFELINPLPIPLDEGVKDIDAFTMLGNREVFLTFLKQHSPEVIHVHTLMGIYKEFFEAAQMLNIKTMFTTHDYYGICPKVTLYRHGYACEDDHDCLDCVSCNQSALSLKKIKILQSPVYRQLKNSPLVKKIRKNHRGSFFEAENEIDINMENDEIEKLGKGYRRLREYYTGILLEIDLIHFNSSVAENIYKRFITPQNVRTVTITHKDIGDYRNQTKSDSDKLRITCLAPAKPFKGYNILKTALDELWESGERNFKLKMFSPVPEPRQYMVVQENGFEYSKLANIMEETDVLVAPSVWYETFGFTVLEAISYGVPVIVSDNVGAKDIIGSGGIIVKAGSVEELKEAIVSLSKQRVLELRNNIRKEVNIKTWDRFLDENYMMYEE